ncbi:tyrosine-protein phosphatase [Nocardioides lentus]|uniref:Tyrosine-protein phosphatase n=1 Tax=Nocardioides lentus TaxID=338077 RepID=A0ABP5AAH5_9ACTN
MSREVAADGLHNVRDLGGLPTARAAAGLTSYGVVVRAPRRELLTARGWEQLRAYGVRAVVDLRNDDERGPRPGDPDPPSRPGAGVTVRHRPTEDPAHAEFVRVCGPILDRPAYWGHNLRLLPHLVADALSAVARSEGAVLLHCSAGRDRTGMLSALLLAHAGVAPEVVADDWELSVRAMLRRPPWSGAEDHLTTLAPDALEAWVARGRREVVALVDRDVDALLATVGIAARDRRSLRDRLTG